MHWSMNMSSPQPQGPEHNFQKYSTHSPAPDAHVFTAFLEKTSGRKDFWETPRLDQQGLGIYAGGQLVGQVNKPKS